MYRHSHRHDDCCESSDPCCEPPISWPQRPSFPNFPGIATFWPMPFAVPIGPWGGMRSGYEPPYYSHRRYDMYRYRCCEPRYRRHAECCERCGEYDCRCERRCERCGEYDCRCERRCERCGRRDCRCGEYVGSGRVSLTVVPPNSGLNFATRIDPDCFDADAQPVVYSMAEGKTGASLGQIQVHNNQGAIEIVLTLPPKPPFPQKGYYLGSVYDSRHPDEPIAYLKIKVY
jgi:hypothetical protein